MIGMDTKNTSMAVTPVLLPRISRSRVVFQVVPISGFGASAFALLELHYSGERIHSRHYGACLRSPSQLNILVLSKFAYLTDVALTLQHIFCAEKVQQRRKILLLIAPNTCVAIHTILKRFVCAGTCLAGHPCGNVAACMQPVLKLLNSSPTLRSANHLVAGMRFCAVSYSRQCTV